MTRLLLLQNPNLKKRNIRNKLKPEIEYQVQVQCRKLKKKKTEPLSKCVLDEQMHTHDMKELKFSDIKQFVGITNRIFATISFEYSMFIK